MQKKVIKQQQQETVARAHKEAEEQKRIKGEIKGLKQHQDSEYHAKA